MITVRIELKMSERTLSSWGGPTKVWEWNTQSGTEPYLSPKERVGVVVDTLSRGEPWCRGRRVTMFIIKKDKIRVKENTYT